MENIVPSCEVCNDPTDPYVGVASIPGIPMSVAWGRRCLDAGVIPLWVAVTNTALVGGYDHSAEWWTDLVDITLEYFGKDREWFDAEVQRQLDEEYEYFRNLEEPENSDD